jgi:hypothetical protein
MIYLIICLPINEWVLSSKSWNGCKLSVRISSVIGCADYGIVVEQPIKYYAYVLKLIWKHTKECYTSKFGSMTFLQIVVLDFHIFYFVMCEGLKFIFCCRHKSLLYHKTILLLWLKLLLLFRAINWKSNSCV